MNENNIPLSQELDAHKLESDGIRELFKIQLSDGVTLLYITAHNSVTWGDQTWEEWPCTLSDTSQNSTGEKSRPKFSLANPTGVFSLWVSQGVCDGAIVTRYRVLKTDLDSDVRAYAKNVWTVFRVTSLNKDLVVFECRSLLDGQSFQLPARAFYPPDFPHVSLQ